MHNKNRFKAVLLLALLLLLPACGYGLSKTGSASIPGASVPAGAYKVCVALFENATFEPLVEKELTAALKDEITADGRWVLTDRDSADFTITGKVDRFELVPLSYDAKERILEYRVRIKTEVKLTEIKTGKVLWKDTGIETFSEYRVTEDITKSKIRRSEAVKKASKDFAQEFVIKAMDIF